MKSISIAICSGVCLLSMSLGTFSAASAEPLGKSAAAISTASGVKLEPIQYLPRSGFRYPHVRGAIVDWCATWANNCGAGGASLFCRTRGFDGALSWDVYHPGRTYVIGSGRFCEGGYCKGFSFVRCG